MSNLHRNRNRTLYRRLLNISAFTGVRFHRGASDENPESDERVRATSGRALLRSDPQALPAFPQPGRGYGLSAGPRRERHPLLFSRRHPGQRASRPACHAYRVVQRA